MTRMTITEALAEIKTLQKRIAKRRDGVTAYLVRQEKLKDPLEKDGGSRAFIKSERQAIGDLESRVVAIRRAIMNANAGEKLAIKGVSRTIADWLVWKREVAPGTQQFLGNLQKGIANVRAEAARKGLQVSATEAGAKPDDVIVNINEVELAGEIDAMEEILGTLDGQLSLKNATVLVEV